MILTLGVNCVLNVFQSSMLWVNKLWLFVLIHFQASMIFSGHARSISLECVTLRPDTLIGQPYFQILLNLNILFREKQKANFVTKRESQKVKGLTTLMPA
jgi:hypothetical protein